MIDNRSYMIILYDYYGGLLNDKQQEYFENYYFDNLSLGEISDNLEVSRNAVHKTLKSVEEKLEFYEERLRLYEKSKKIEEVLDRDSLEKIKDLY